jgi:DNA replication protein DnaC
VLLKWIAGRGCAPVLKPPELSHAEWLALLLDREAANRNTRRFQIRLRSAKLRHSQAVVEDVDYRPPRRLDKALFQQLTAGKWIAEHRNLLVTGPCGIGKSWLACALAQKACRDGYTVVYARVPRLFADLELAHGDIVGASVMGTGRAHNPT